MKHIKLYESYSKYNNENISFYDYNNLIKSNKVESLSKLDISTIKRELLNLNPNITFRFIGDCMNILFNIEIVTDQNFLKKLDDKGFYIQLYKHDDNWFYTDLSFFVEDVKWHHGYYKCDDIYGFLDIVKRMKMLYN